MNVEQVCPSYNAPEIICNKESSNSASWALGCFIAHLALGRPLFNATGDQRELLEIFKLVGTPAYLTLFKGAKVPQFKRVYFPDICREGAAAFAIIKEYQGIRGTCLKDLGLLKEKIGFTGLDLLYKLLNPIVS